MEVPLAEIEDIKENILKQGTITDIGFKALYGDNAEEMDQGFETGRNYLNLFREDTVEQFEILDGKYHTISLNMLKIVGELKEERKFTEERFDKTQKNIEQLMEMISKSNRKI